MTPALIVIAALVALYAVFVIALIASGRRRDARALAGFLPDCALLFKRLSGDDRVPGRSKLALVLLAGYIAMPIDLVPDFIPVAGQLDDALLAALVLRAVVRGAGPDVVREHWPGPQRSLAVLLRLAGAGSA